jgi:hypothetical protein
MSAGIQKEVQTRGITRICHFTQSRNLVHIASDSEGVKSTKALQADQNACFTATDTKRIDGYTDHICCSVEYPNAWYLARAVAKEILFKDWVVLFVSPVYLWNPDTRFCARNAAAGGGAYIVKSLAGFQSLFAQEVDGAGGNTRRRLGNHLVCSPTDDQAEVLVKAKILQSAILGVAVKDEKQAKNEIARLRYAGVTPDAFRFVIAPILFDKYGLASAIRSGKRPQEKLYP